MSEFTAKKLLQWSADLEKAPICFDEWYDREEAKELLDMKGTFGTVREMTDHIGRGTYQD